jgi:chemotaxis signal transduction protein
VHRFLICKADNRVFGVPVSRVRDILPIGTTNALPNAPAYVRGVGSIRGEMRVLLELRTVLGLHGRRLEREERLRNFRQRRQDHIDWLDELTACVEEGRPFKKALDPTACAFGRWYKTFRSSDALVNIKLRAFDVPHRRVHSVGVQVVDLMAKGEVERARACVEAARARELAALLHLFDEAEPLMAFEVPEVTILLDTGDSSVGLIVDEVRELAALAPDSRADEATTHMLFAGRHCVVGVAHHGSEMVFLIDPRELPSG